MFDVLLCCSKKYREVVAVK